MATNPIKERRGRPRGALNKTTRSIKQAVEKAFHYVNDRGYLLKLADEHPAVFCALVGKIIPAEIQANMSLDVNMQVNIGEAMALAAARLAGTTTGEIIDVEPLAPAAPAIEVIDVDTIGLAHLDGEAMEVLADGADVIAPEPLDTSVRLKTRKRVRKSEG